MAKAENASTTIDVSVDLLDRQSSETVPDVKAYAFSADATFLAAAPVNKDGHAVLKLPAVQAVANVRVLVGPASDDKTASFEACSQCIRR
jgi:hypothetical protein